MFICICLDWFSWALTVQLSFDRLSIVVFLTLHSSSMHSTFVIRHKYHGLHLMHVVYGFLYTSERNAESSSDEYSDGYIIYNQLIITLLGDRSYDPVVDLLG